ncbi:unnamed protein product [Linum trigynum]|uniref:Uncharacterized protein n=1 Tax=Linum trigynum TaxID=586398 RepID=A0AAV2E513_9ROSI
MRIGGEELTGEGTEQASRGGWRRAVAMTSDNHGEAAGARGLAVGSNYRQREGFTALPITPHYPFHNIKP